MRTAPISWFFLHFFILRGSSLPMLMQRLGENVFVWNTASVGAAPQINTTPSASQRDGLPAIIRQSLINKGT